MQAPEQLFYFIRHPGAVITEESFTKALQFGSVRGEPLRSFLRQLTWLHAPAVALSTSWDRSKQAQQQHRVNDFLAFLSGVFSVPWKLVFIRLRRSEMLSCVCVCVRAGCKEQL